MGHSNPALIYSFNVRLAAISLPEAPVNQCEGALSAFSPIRFPA